MLRGAVLPCLVILLFLLLGIGCATPIDPEQHREVTIVAHRGFAREHVQNTIPALVAAAESGADAVEFDISVSADRTPYVFHDRRVDALTDGTGRFTRLPDAYIESLRYTEADGTELEGIGIPKLSEVLDALQDKDCIIYPEIKRIHSERDIHRILALLQEYGFEQSSNIISFNLSDLEVVREVLPEVPISYIARFRALPDLQWLESEVDRIQEYDQASILFHYVHILNEPEIAAYAKEAGVDIGAWRVNRESVFSRLLALGVDIIITGSSRFLP